MSRLVTNDPENLKLAIFEMRDRIRAQDPSLRVVTKFLSDTKAEISVFTSEDRLIFLIILGK